jgi:hypothetical protein
MRYIISESQYSLLMNVSFDGLFEQTNQNQTIIQRYGTDPAKAPSDYLGKGRTFETTNFTDPKVMTLAIGKKKGSLLEDAMESFREGLFTPSGIAISAFLTSFGWGAPLVMTSYAALLAWDIYKSLNGDTDWLNIIIDTISLITSGALSGVFSPLIKAGRTGLTSIAKVFEYLKSTTIWKSITPYLKAIVNGISKVGAQLVEGIKWLANNTGLSFLLKVASKVTGFFGSITASILKAIGNVTTGAFNKIGTATSNIVSKMGAGAKVAGASASGAKTYVGNKAFEKGMNLATTSNQPTPSFDDEFTRYSFGDSGSAEDKKKLKAALAAGWKPGQPVPAKYQTTLYKEGEKLQPL